LRFATTHTTNLLHAFLAYRFHFNGQEADNEVAGSGNSYTAEFWQYDSRLGRRWNVDPVVKHWESGFAVLSNNPITKIDPKGLSDYYTKDGEYLGSDGTNGTDIYIVTDASIISSLRTQVNEANDRQYVNVGQLNLSKDQFFKLPSFEDRQMIKSKITEVSYDDGYFEIGGTSYIDKEDKVQHDYFRSKRKSLNDIGNNVAAGKDADEINLSPGVGVAKKINYTWHLHSEKIKYVKHPQYKDEYMLLSDYELSYGNVATGQYLTFGGLETSKGDQAMESETNFLFARLSKTMLFFSKDRTTEMKTSFFYNIKARTKPQ